MSEKIKDTENTEMAETGVVETTKTGGSKFEKLMAEPFSKVKLTGMYQNWFLDYASYVILERAVPHLIDGFKPVQRRIMHAMRKIEDGRYNKVAAIVGDTMHFHPHGDASIGDALVQLGQKDLLVDCQGNWGNILTGDDAAAPRYIEARLTKFALEVVFNPKTTEWMLSYDGRNKEPVTLPVKFPLLLAQGAEGIAVGLASKILPHNFNELIDSCIAYLSGEEFELYPDFPTGGLIDCSKYNDGLKGGVVRARARISKVDKKTLAITEIPFGTTSESLKESIVKAIEKGKIKAKKVDDNTADKVEIVVHVSNDESTDKMIDALYAFTDCEMAIWPNSCVIYEDKPHFLGVKEILRRSAKHTRELLGKELQIRINELDADWHRCSLEKIFIENKIYQVMEGCTTREQAYDEIDKRLEPFKKLLKEEVTREDVIKLTELKFIRITRYDSEKADNEIKGIEAELLKVKNDLAHLTEYTIAYYKSIKERYGKGRERRSELKTFDTIEAATVAVVNSKLYVDREGGFFGIGNAMKQHEFVCDCSDMDDVIVFTTDGKYIITKVSDKAFFAPNIYYIGVFKRNDERTIYNVLYRDGDKGAVMMKRCAIKGITRDKEYDITKGTPKSAILYMSVNPNGEAEVLKIIFKQRTRMKKSIVDLDFSNLLIKGRQSNGNLFSRYAIHKIVVKTKGTSTLAGQNIWFDEEIVRLNTAGRGRLLGEFEGDDKIIVVTKGGKYYITGYNVGHHFPEDWMIVEKYDPETIYSVAYWDDTQKFYYLKRFATENTDKMQPFIDEENPKSRMICMSGHPAPLLEVTYKNKNGEEVTEEIDAESFIGVKSHRAKGKRISTNEIVSLRFIEPELPEEPQEDGIDDEAAEISEPTTAAQENKPQEMNGADQEERKSESGDDFEFEIVLPKDEDERDDGSVQLDLFQ
ncbi:MAG: DNA gyrase/topoisomerase IV subunit A [Tidjanibacter sp.]|nr:DNA gyrase/topoisomerase IV subunit A [Tidjanibacter sp.]